MKKFNNLTGAKCSDISEIRYLPIAELQARRVSAWWLLECYWADWMYQRFLRAGVSGVKSRLPDAYCGDEGVATTLRAGYGHDFFRKAAEVDLYQLYWRHGGRHFIRSFARPGALTGCWAGNYGWLGGELDEPWMRQFPWLSLFSGSNSTWWWMTELSLYCNGEPIPAFVQFAEEVRRIKSGFATLLLKSAEQEKNMALIVYSPASVYSETFYNTKNAVRGRIIQSITSFCEALSAAGIPFKLIHESELARLSVKDCRLLVIPAVTALPSAGIRAVRSFVNAGGLLIADQLPNMLRDEYGQTLHASKVPVYLTAAGAGERAEGRGRVLTVSEKFTPLLVEQWNFVPGQTWCEKNQFEAPNFIAGWVKKHTGYTPEFTFRIMENQQIDRHAEIGLFRDGSACNPYYNFGTSKGLKTDHYDNHPDIYS